MRGLYLSPIAGGDVGPAELFGAAAAASYEGVGVRLAASPHLSVPVQGGGADIAELRQLKSRLGLRIFDVTTFYVQPTTVVRNFEAALRAGAMLGAEYVLSVGDDPEWSRLVDRYGELSELAASAGLTVAIEFVPFRAVSSLARCLELIECVGRANLRICIDCFHFARSNAPLAELRQLDAAHVAYIQMSDGIVRTGSGAVNDRRLIGRGEVKLDTMLAALPGGVPISVELPMNRPAGVSFASWAGAGMREAERILRSRPVGEVPKER